MAENKFDKDTVEHDFNKFCEDWDIDNEVLEMEEDEADDFKNFKRRLTRVMKQGRLIYKDDESFDYTCLKPVGQDSEVIPILRPKGNHYLDMDRYKDKQSIHKKNAVLANMIKMPPSFVGKLDGVDLKILDAVLTLFLVS